MRKLFQFLYRYRAFFIFLVLQAICAWMIVANNNYQRTVYLNTTSRIAGSVIEKADNVSDFFSLRKVNEDLAEENARLRQLLLNSNVSIPDSTSFITIPSDSLDSMEYIAHSAEVIRNTIRNTNNFITLNKGSKDGLMAGMGVVNKDGVVGKIRSVSSRRAQVISLLNTNNPISSKLLRTNRLGTIQWDGSDPRTAKLLYVPVDVDIQVGDTVVTSSFNAIFPKNMMIGVVKSAKPDIHQRDYEIEVKLSVDFGALSYVSAIENRLKPETDSLSVQNPGETND